MIRILCTEKDFYLHSQFYYVVLLENTALYSSPESYIISLVKMFTSSFPVVCVNTCSQFV